MKIKIIFDKRASNKRLKTGWGVSFLIDNKILFDTGENGNWLLENMHLLNVDVDKIESIVISHDHWDHWGGLWDLLARKKNTRVYICPHFSANFKNKARGLQAELIESDRFTEIASGIFVTGEISGAYNGKYMAEQGLALKTSKGITFITGCAHPGISRMVEKTKNYFVDEPIYFVMGGFHMMNSDKRAVEIAVEDFRRIGVMKAGPTHCSGEIAEGIFKNSYNKNFLQIEAGDEIEV